METATIKKLNEEQQVAFDLVRDTNRSFFLTGKAGTGKTTFVKYIQETLTDKRFVIVAPTGLAAITAGGQTIHSFFGLPLDPIAPDAEFEMFNINYEKQCLLQKVDTIIMDEVSMVKCDIVDAVDSILRHVMKNSMPFGGKQVIFIGDLYQLDPIVDTNDEGLRKFYHHYYNTTIPYFFKARVFQSYLLPSIEFSKVYRQKDKEFLQMLEHIRIGKYVKEEIDKINLSSLGNILTEEHNTKENKDLVLTPFNKKADNINNMELEKIPNQAYTYIGKLEGDFNRKNFPAPYELTLKEGAQVMFCRNDADHQWVNGTLGVVSSLSEDSISVMVDEEEIQVAKETWEAVKYVFNEKTQKLDKEVIGTYTQYPLRLAWAITIHKSQGLTFDRVTLDPNGIFSPGQLYVALSRVRSLEGLTLVNRVYQNYIYVKQDINTFMMQYSNLSAIQNDIILQKPVTEAITKCDYDAAASYLLRQVLSAVNDSNIDKAWHGACQMMSVLYNLDIFTMQETTEWLSGDDEKTLFLNTIIAICNRKYDFAIALAERGCNLNINSDFDYLKCIALFMNSNYDEAELALTEWKNKLKEHNRVLDDRYYYLLAWINKKQGKPYISATQHVIRHTPRYIAPLLFLKESMNEAGLKLETGDDNSRLVDAFNQSATSQEFQNAWKDATSEERATLILAVLDYPYEQ